CPFWVLASSRLHRRGAACSMLPSASSSMRPGWRSGQGLRYFSRCFRSTSSATAYATRSTRARVEYGVARSAKALLPETDLVQLAEGPMRELRDALARHSVVLSEMTPCGALVPAGF